MTDLTTASKLLDSDKGILEAARSMKIIAKLNAEKTLAQNEVAELRFELLLTRMAMKYGLNEGDQLKDDGSIIRNKEEK